MAPRKTYTSQRRTIAHKRTPLQRRTTRTARSNSLATLFKNIFTNRRVRSVIEAALIMAIFAVGVVGLKYQLFASSIYSQKADTNKHVALTYKKSFDHNTIVERVREQIAFPDEPSLISLIRNAEALQKAQPFFNGAQDGDVVLWFPQYAVVYRVSYDKIVNAGAFVFSREQRLPDSDILVQPITIEIRNGTGSAGRARSMQQSLEILNHNQDVIAVSNAEHQEYKNRILINLTSNNDTYLSQLAAMLNAQYSTVLPENERESDADVVLILGE